MNETLSIFEYLSYSTTLGLALLANIILIVVILRDTRLRTKYNIIVINYCIADLLQIFEISSTHILYKWPIIKNTQCYFNNHGDVLNVAEILLIFLLIFECTTMLKTRPFQVLITLIWLFAVSLRVYTTLMCANKLNSEWHNISIGIYLIVTLITVVQFVRIFCGKRVFSNYLNIALVYLLVNLKTVLTPSEIYYDIVNITLNNFHYVFSAIVLLYLYFSDERLRLSFRSLLRCRVEEHILSVPYDEQNNEIEDDRFSVDLSYSRANESIS